MESPFPPEIAFAARELTLEAGLELLAEEAEAMGPAASASRREQFALGRACARDALRALGITGEPPIGRAHGRAPRWPPGIVGSITHSHGHAAAAAALAHQYRGIGLDLEQLRIPSDALLRRVARAEELTALQAEPSSVALGFTALFAAKESIYKAVNPLTGTYLGFQDAQIVPHVPAAWGHTEGEFVWRLEKDAGPGFPLGFQGHGRWKIVADWAIAGVWIPI